MSDLPPRCSYAVERRLPSDPTVGFLGDLSSWGNHLIASGGTYHRPTFFHSSDGREFSRLLAPPVSGFRGHYLAAPDQLFVTAEAGEIFFSDTLGQDWLALEPPVDHECLYSIAADPQGTLYATGDDGLILCSHDGGFEWELFRVGEGRVLQMFGHRGQMFFLGDQLHALKGEAFKRIPLPSQTAPLTAMHEMPNGDLLLVGDRGQIYRSTDGGDTWKPQSSGTQVDFEDLEVIRGEVWLVGSGGTLWISPVGSFGRHFASIPLPSLDATHLWSIAPSRTGAFIGGNQGLLLHVAPKL